MSFCTACGCERIGANHFCDGCGAELDQPERQEDHAADPWVPAQARSGSWASGFSTTWSFTGASGPVPPSPVTRPDLGVGLLDSLLAPPDPAGEAWPDVLAVDAGADARYRSPGRFRWLAVATGAAKSAGTVLIIQRSDRLEEILAHFARLGWGDVTIKRLPPAARVLIRARRAGTLRRIESPPLVLHRPEGGYTDAAEAVLRHAAPLAF